MSSSNTPVAENFTNNGVNGQGGGAFSEIETRLTERIVADARAFFHLNSPASLLRKTVLTMPYSTVLRLELDVGSRRQTLYAKVPKVSASNEKLLHARLKTEFEIMHRLSEGRKDAKHGVARPFAFYAEYPAVVTLAAEGTSFRQVYRFGARRVFSFSSRKALVDYVSSCGEWLRAFQRVTSRGFGAFDMDEFSAYCDIRLQMLVEDRETGFSRALASEVLTAAARMAESIDPASHRIGGRHNDFASHNIIADGGKIRVIDFSMFDYGSCAYDACNFWLEIEMLKYDWTYSPRFLVQLQSRFLEAYGGVSPEDPAFRLAQLRYSLNRFLTAWSGRHGRGLDARYRTRVARVLRDWLVQFATRGAVPVVH